MTTNTLVSPGPPAIRLRLADRYFYFGMAILIAVIVLYGFSNTVGGNLFHPVHPAIARPHILYLHAALFLSWIALFVVQTALIRARNLRLHRRLGVFGVVLGISMFWVGLVTAIVMRKYRLAHDSTETAAFLAIPFNDLLDFTIAFALALAWRQKPELHRRLMLFATIALTGAAFARFPLAMMNNPWFFYVGTDLLVAIAAVRDLVTTRRIHPVYLLGLPAMMCGEYGGVYLFLHQPPAWLAICRFMLG
ncbi:MAG: hypothetical protein ACREHF_02450 [Rhizomicrobium sp.]